MTLTMLLITLKLLHVFVEPAHPLEKDDQTLATCAVQKMTARPTTLVIVPSKDMADVTLRIQNAAGLRIHVVGTLIGTDEKPLIEVDHVTHGFNHSLCNQADGLLDEMAEKMTDKQRGRT